MLSPLTALENMTSLKRWILLLPMILVGWAAIFWAIGRNSAVQYVRTSLVRWQAAPRIWKCEGWEQKTAHLHT